MNPDLTPDQVQVALKESADDLGAVGFDSNYGSGRVNLEHALILAVGAGDDFDRVVPTVSIGAPADGATVSGTIAVRVTASDDVGVIRVEFYVDGVLSASSTASPLTMKWNTRRVASGAHTLQSKAYDAAGNIGTSLPFTVYK